MAETAPKAVGGESFEPLLERDQEVEAFERAFDRLTQGVGSLILVEGPAGIGKTALLAAASALARERESLVRAARGGELEREMPFGVARQLFEPLVERASDEERSRLLAGSAGLALAALGHEDPQRAGAAADPFAPIHGLYWLVANLAETEPVVLLVDDAHWIDSQTLRFLVYLARRLADIPVLVIACVRSGEPGEPAELDPLRLEGEVLRPAPLSPEAVEQLIETGLEATPAPEFSAVCAEATAGNPFLLAEVVRTLRADRAEPSAEAADSIAALGPESVARYVLMRLGRFGEEAISLARAIAILGDAPQVRHAATLSGLDEDQAEELCDRLRAAEILAPGLPIEFVHPLVRSAIYKECSEQVRTAGHRRAADVLSSAGIEPAEIASHLVRCTPSGDQWVVSQLGAAASAAGRAGAHAAARSYLERALDEPPDDELPLRYALGCVLAEADPLRAPAILDEVVEASSDRSLRLKALRQIPYAYSVADDWSRAADRFEAVIEELRPDEFEQRLLLESQLVVIVASTRGRTDATTQRIAKLVASSPGHTPGGCFVRQALGFDRFHGGAPADEVLELVRHFAPREWQVRVIVTPAACNVLAWCGRFDEARDRIMGFIDASRERGLFVAASYGFGFLSEIECHAGRAGEAEAAGQTAREIARSAAPGATGASVVADVHLVKALVLRGKLDEAQELMDSDDLMTGLKRVHFSPLPIEVRGYLRLAKGELADGVTDMLEFGAAAERLRFLNPVIPWRQEAAPALAGLDRTAEAKVLIEVAEERARRFGAAHVIGTTLRARGLIEPRKRSIRTLRESVAALEEYGPPHELARSLVELGAAMRRDKQRSDSREPLRRALELAHSSGAGGVEARAREELAAAGSRPRSVFRTGVASLTASELRTAKLAAEGLTNVEIAQRLFVSRKTVEKHLGNAYMKLEIGGREELAGVLRATET